MKSDILFFTNLHPLPWQPTRATYNQEEIRHLRSHANITLLVPVPWFVWIKEVLVNGHRAEGNSCLFPFFYIPKVLSFLHPIFMLLSIIVCIKPLLLFAKADNVIASWAYSEGVCSAVLKKLFKFKLIIECLGSDVNALMKKPLHRIQMKWAFKTATSVTTKSYALAKVIKQHAPSITAEVVYNGVDFDTFFLRETSVFQQPNSHFVFIGSIIPTKGIFELVEGIAALKDELSITLSIIGSGSSQAQLKEKVESFGLQQTISILGPIPHSQLCKHIQDADALILPSYREGVPNVVMESLATGTPVIATTVGGIPEVLMVGVNGTLIEPLSAASIVAGIKSTMQTKWKPDIIRSSIKDYTWVNTAKKISELFI
ncbi:glycosyltransferase [Alteromonas sp. MMG017]|uniref:glycosyltransferase n=1 Tax=Alteromonas sp. MMG017 TaxID=2822692 RepID=UPI001B39E3C3|nr:glycosyltransferase [Alteromonas sp. MMG017]MBQ4829550.1 glycosyltransferase [Alteromonas sp. MMG017]